MLEHSPGQIFATDPDPEGPPATSHKIIRWTPAAGGALAAALMLLSATPAGADSGSRISLHNTDFSSGEAYWQKSAYNPAAALMFIDLLAGVNQSPAACTMFIQPGPNRAEWSKVVKVVQYHWYEFSLETRVQNFKPATLPGSTQLPAGSYATIEGGIGLLRSPDIKVATPSYARRYAVANSGLSNQLTIKGVLGWADFPTVTCIDDAIFSSLTSAQAGSEILAHNLG